MKITKEYQSAVIGYKRGRELHTYTCFLKLEKPSMAMGDLKKLFAEAQKDFPDLKEEHVRAWRFQSPVGSQKDMATRPGPAMFDGIQFDTPDEPPAAYKYKGASFGPWGY